MIHFIQPVRLDVIFAWLRSPFDFPRTKEVPPPSLGISLRASSAYNELVDDCVDASIAISHFHRQHLMLLCHGTSHERIW